MQMRGGRSLQQPSSCPGKLPSSHLLTETPDFLLTTGMGREGMEGWVSEREEGGWKGWVDWFADGWVDRRKWEEIFNP